jgi:hypothetical protein
METTTTQAPGDTGDPRTSEASPPTDLDGQLPDGRDVMADLQALVGEMQSVFSLIEHAEDEISQAMQRHPGHADRIWHSFSLLTPTLDRLATEVVYRAHCRELLDRVARGEDTRPATAAECCVALMETSLAAPRPPAQPVSTCGSGHTPSYPISGSTRALARTTKRSKATRSMTTSNGFAPNCAGTSAHCRPRSHTCECARTVNTPSSDHRRHPRCRRCDARRGIAVRRVLLTENLLAVQHGDRTDVGTGRLPTQRRGLTPAIARCSAFSSG